MNAEPARLDLDNFFSDNHLLLMHGRKVYGSRFGHTKTKQAFMGSWIRRLDTLRYLSLLDSVYKCNSVS